MIFKSSIFELIIQHNSQYIRLAIILVKSLNMSSAQKTPKIKTIKGRSLPDSHRAKHGLKDYLAKAFANNASKLVGVVKPDQFIPHPAADFYQPTNNNLPFNGTHFGIMIADLPQPHYFLSFASILGMPGIKVVDADHFVKDDGPLHTATLVHGTAAAHQNAFSTYSMKKDMTFVPANNTIQFGKDAEISGTYPDFRLISQRDGFSTDLKLTATDAYSWFAYSPVYQHVSLLVEYEGTITHNGQSTAVSGLGTWEYWKVISLSYPLNKIIPKALKLPIDFFTYQVLTLDQDTQLLLGFVTMLDKPATTFAMLRFTNGQSKHLDTDIRFQVLSAQAEPALGDDGNLMTLPKTFRWTVTSKRGESLFDINATVDTPMLFGLATGYVGGYHWYGTRDDKPFSGRGYIEYIDQRD